MPIYPRDSIVISRAVNGFVMTTKGTIEQQEDGLCGQYAFESIDSLIVSLKEILEAPHDPNKWTP